MTGNGGVSAVTYSGLCDVPLSDLILEFDRLERLLAHGEGHTPPAAGGPDLPADALTTRERAVVAEIRRRPGGSRLWSLHASKAASAPTARRGRHRAAGAKVANTGRRKA